MASSADEPRAMVSLIFGDLDDDRWYAQGAPEDPFTPGRVRWWNIHARRLLPASGSPIVPSTAVDAAIAKLAATGASFVVEARTPVGMSFSGTAADFLAAFGFDPFELQGRIVVPEPLGDLPVFPRDNELKQGVVAMEINPVARPVAGVSRRHVLQTLAATALVACVGDESDDKPDPDDTMVTMPPTGVTGDTGTGPVLTGLRADPISGLVDQLDLRGVSETGRRIRVAIVDSGLAFDGIVPVVEAAGQPLVAPGPEIAGLSAASDEWGHGTAVFHHLVTAAPAVDVRSFKYTDYSGFRNYPVAAFQRALAPDPEDEDRPGLPWPDIVLCSWVMADLSVALQREIAYAAERGVKVIFAAGNGSMADVAPSVAAIRISSVAADNEVRAFPVAEARTRTQSARQHYPVAHPEALSVGGAAPDGGGFAASPVATFFTSEVFSAGEQPEAVARRVPEVCGVVAPAPPVGDVAALHETRTSVGSVMDTKPDGSTRIDGIVRTAGTSMAAAQVAGVVARLLEKYGASTLAGEAVRHVLMATARDVTAGAGPGFDEPTGYGVVSGRAAMDWLDADVAFLRSALGDDGTVPRTVTDGVSSPDIIVRPVAPFGPNPEDAQAFWGLPAHPVADLSGPLGPGSYELYVRVSNRSAGPWSGQLDVYEVRFGATITTAPASAPGPSTLAVDAGGFGVIGPFQLQVPAGVRGILVCVDETPAPSYVDEGELLMDLGSRAGLGIRWVEET